MILNYFKNILRYVQHFKKTSSIKSYGSTPLSLPLNQSIEKNFIHTPIELTDYVQKEFHFSPEDYVQFQSQVLNNTFFLNEKNKEVLQKIHEELLYIKDIFSPFDTQKIPLEIILTGGALRDFILGKSDCIKDLDITIHFQNNYKQYSMYQGCHNMASVIDILLKDKHIEYSHLSELKKNFEITNQYAYMHNLLEEVIEFKGKNFPIQLLCTNNSSSLIQHFDFDICKVGLRFFCNHSYLKQVNIPECLEEYISRVEYDLNFLSHVLSKKLIYRNAGKEEAQITSELTQHYPRIAEKYPDFHCDISFKEDKNYPFTKQLFDKVSLFNQLKIEKNNIPSHLKKNKTNKI